VATDVMHAASIQAQAVSYMPNPIAERLQIRSDARKHRRGRAAYRAVLARRRARSRLCRAEDYDPRAETAPTSFERTLMARAVRVILVAGAICGILDAASAIGVLGLFGVSPERVFQGIARGLLGLDAFKRGAFSVGVGLAVHFVVAVTAAAVYYAASRLWPAVNNHARVAGVLYGIGVHLFMNFVVIPLSAIGWRPIAWPVFLAVLLVHIVVVGPSIALTVRWFARRPAYAAHPTPAVGLS